jgi:hypothetical protein
MGVPDIRREQQAIIYFSKENEWKFSNRDRIFYIKGPYQQLIEYRILMIG